MLQMPYLDPNFSDSTFFYNPPKSHSFTQNQVKYEITKQRYSD
ncbi:unnamed protein product (macronuclear) [Paramecium tetraurelia]|uniref:Uncharacterized protein n=1 Tax=Paramecium tetraurelia TaxID=5888 RepID=A0BFF7_PARTE|nr:uncharacterized protein GSPATT00028309001 [Paramecium tetraurelia]CAK57274.1 unnamed protein product [Paramecium tetraurelia]